MGKHRAGKGKSAKKARAGLQINENDYSKIPHTFVFNRNRVGKNVSQLIQDMKKVMEPYTASKLKAKKNNHLRDFVGVASDFDVSHLIMFTKSDIGIYMKIGRLPRGPTLTFKINSYSLIRDVVASMKRHRMDIKQFEHHPLLIMNNFGEEALNHKLIATMWQNMFPAIHINKAKLNQFKRCVVLNYNSEDQTIDFRHYNVRAVPTGLSKPVKKIVCAKLPDLSKFQDISEYIIKGGNMSESEAEPDGLHNEVILPQHISGPGNIKSAKSAIRLTEIGPRINMSLMKIYEGLNDGQIIYHSLKSPQTKKRKLNDSKRLNNSKKLKTDLVLAN